MAHKELAPSLGTERKLPVQRVYAAVEVAGHLRSGPRQASAHRDAPVINTLTRLVAAQNRWGFGNVSIDSASRIVLEPGMCIAGRAHVQGDRPKIWLIGLPLALTCGLF
ncbi:MAG: hypothetical protein D6690_05250 [Nitrospirae bacterium]|nr:MAG: hypothetical protein D6690_05250 [Nitrospirota bacterium]